MRFIRDIIGEKRQMDNTVNGAPATKQVDDVLAEGILGDPIPATEAKKPNADLPVDDTAHKNDVLAEENQSIDSLNGDFPDDFAAFFADDEDEAEVAEPRVKVGLHDPEPSDLDLGDTAFSDTQGKGPETSATVGETIVDAMTENGGTEQFDCADVQDHEPDDVLTATLKAETEFVANEPVPHAQEAPTNPAFSNPFADDSEAPLEETEQNPLEKPERQNLFSESSAPAPQEASEVEAQMPETVEVPQPAIGRSSSSHGRVKTRLLGFNTAQNTDIDPISDSKAATAAVDTMFPVGWLIVVDGAGRGSAFTLFNGVSNIGRGEDQTVRLDFGDNSISRENHASIAYDPRQKAFFIGHGGKANLVRRNDRPVLSTEEMLAGDLISIGETTLRFVPFCGPDFVWEEPQETGRAHASQG